MCGSPQYVKNYKTKIDHFTFTALDFKSATLPFTFLHEKRKDSILFVIFYKMSMLSVKKKTVNVIQVFIKWKIRGLKLEN